MGLFDFSKKKEKKQAVPSKAKAQKRDDFELGEDGIKFTAIIEVLGAPKKYVEETAQAFIDKIKTQHDYHIYSSDVSKSTKAAESEEAKATKQDLFTAYAEITIGVKKKEKLFHFCFDFMPSSIEVIEPMTTTFSANELSGFLSDIQATLHKIDFAFKQTSTANKIMTERMQILTKNASQILQNNILLSLKDKNKSLADLAKNTGVPEEQLKPFIDSMIKRKDIVFEKNVYKLSKK
ncbi:MAG TPA: hypothetical protein VKE88_02995 [Candidatus Nanoarchaeia archaeon]|nr:hypothetical protein [Candidatus Nanoarchaeia archaeon]